MCARSVREVLACGGAGGRVWAGSRPCTTPPSLFLLPQLGPDRSPWSALHAVPPPTCPPTSPHTHTQDGLGSKNGKTRVVSLAHPSAPPDTHTHAHTTTQPHWTGWTGWTARTARRAWSPSRTRPPLQTRTHTRARNHTTTQDGLDSKNGKTRVVCIEEVGAVVDREGAGVYRGGGGVRASTASVAGVGAPSEGASSVRAWVGLGVCWGAHAGAPASGGGSPAYPGGHPPLGLAFGGAVVPCSSIATPWVRPSLPRRRRRAGCGGQAGGGP
jgi:hypothetical protein